MHESRRQTALKKKKGKEGRRRERNRREKGKEREKGGRGEKERREGDKAERTQLIILNSPIRKLTPLTF